VAQNDKQRFSLRENENSGKLEIRANQGHTIKNTLKDEELLEPLEEAYHDVVIHGTYHRFWESIRSKGLSRMRRNHIHFAAGEPGAEGVVSGMRDSCQIYIYVDVAKAMEGKLINDYDKQ
jgi:2'-phosphotransferase